MAIFAIRTDGSANNSSKRITANIALTVQKVDPILRDMKTVKPLQLNNVDSIKLGQLADITMGYAFRSRLEAAPDGSLAVIQMKDLTDDNRLDSVALTRIEFAEVKPRQLVAPGDIIFRSRGQTHTAALVDQDPGPAIIAAPLLRIRPREGILPAYLAWFINRPATQARLASRAEGTALRMISKQSLAELEVILPPLEQQRVIVELNDLAAEEQRLMARIADKRKEYIDGILIRAASGSQ